MRQLFVAIITGCLTVTPAVAQSRCSIGVASRRQVVRQSDKRHVVVPFAIPVVVPVTTAQVGLFYHYDYGATAAPYRYSPLTADELADRVAAKVLERFSQVEELRQLGFSQSAVTTHCAPCHSGTASKGDVSLGGIRLSPETRYQALRQVMSGTMPRGTKLSDQERSRLVYELLDLPTTKENEQ